MSKPIEIPMEEVPVVEIPVNLGEEDTGTNVEIGANSDLLNTGAVEEEEREFDRIIEDIESGIPWLEIKPKKGVRVKKEIKEVESEFLEVRFSGGRIFKRKAKKPEQSKPEQKMEEVKEGEETKFVDERKSVDKVYEVRSILSSDNFRKKKMVDSKEKSNVDVEMNILIEYKVNESDPNPVYYLLKMGKWDVEFGMYKGTQRRGETAEMLLELGKLPAIEKLPPPILDKYRKRITHVVIFEKNENGEMVRLPRSRVFTRNELVLPGDRERAMGKQLSEEERKKIEEERANINRLVKERAAKVRQIKERNAYIRKERENIREKYKPKNRREVIKGDIKRIKKIREELEKKLNEKKGTILELNKKIGETTGEEKSKMEEEVRVLGDEVINTEGEIWKNNEEIREQKEEYSRYVKEDIESIGILPIVMENKMLVEEYEESTVNKGTYSKKRDILRCTEEEKEEMDERRRGMSKKLREARRIVNEVELYNALNEIYNFAVKIVPVLEKEEKDEEDIKNIDIVIEYLNEKFPNGEYITYENVVEKIFAVKNELDSREVWIEQNNKLIEEAKAYLDKYIVEENNLIQGNEIDKEWVEQNTGLLIPQPKGVPDIVERNPYVGIVVYSAIANEPITIGKKKMREKTFEEDTEIINCSIKNGDSAIGINFDITPSRAFVNLKFPNDTNEIFKKVLKNGEIKQITYTYSVIKE